MGGITEMCDGTDIKTIDTSPDGAMSYILHITRKAIILFTIPESNCKKIIKFVY